jgi:alkyldihydroxyacetonephosphate synthase
MLGHFPQSFEFSTVGGWAATRSAGQASTGYGRMDELVVALRAATPSGELTTRRAPASAAGPSLLELLLGSEGVLGIITDVTVRVRPRPPQQRFEAWSLPDFAAGGEALRELEQAGAAPDVARLSDEDETRLSLALASRPAITRLLRAYLAARGHPHGCLTIVGFDGEPVQIARRRARARTILRRHGALALGPAPDGHGRERSCAATARSRSDPRPARRGQRAASTAPTCATSCCAGESSSTRSRPLRPGRRSRTSTAPSPARCAGRSSSTRRRRSSPATSRTCIRPAHPCTSRSSHASRPAPSSQWHAAKAAATDAICAAGTTLTHHHAVGRDHAPWLPREIGPLGVEALRALKARLDPAGIMNPGKLIDAAADPPA